MIDLFQDRRIFVNQKRKQFQKNALPDLKYHLALVKKPTDDFIMKTESYSNHNNIMIFNNFQPLSNILISKRICPSSNPQTSIKKMATLNKHLLNNNQPSNLKKQSMKRILHFDQPEQQKQKQKREEHSIVGDPMKLIEETGLSKRNSTSLSYRIRMKERDREKMFVDNVSTGVDETQSRTKLKYQEHYCTFLIPKANNNQDLVREILLSRKIWKQVKPGEQVPNLKWLFSKQRYNYKKMFSYTQKRLINHFEFNEQISTKDNLIRNLQIYCETKKMQIFTITPVTFIIDFDDQYCQYNIKQFLSFFSKHDPRKHSTSPNKKLYTNTNNFVNKFQPYIAWQNSQIKKKVNILSRPVNNNCYYSENSYLWLLKPTGLNRGRGIEIFDSLQTLEKMLMSFLDHLQRKKFTQATKQSENTKKKDKKEKEKESPFKEDNKDKNHAHTNPIKSLEDSICLLNPQKQGQLDQQQPTQQGSPKKACQQKFKLNNCSFVIQKYIQKPFLIEGRKFDIRVWALLTQKMELFFFKQAYIRTSTEQYSTDNIGNYFIHLTNNAIQKNAANYGQFQSGNQLSFKSLSRYMPQEKVTQIWAKIKEITYMAFSSVKKKINFYQRKNCFQLFGLDYFISYDQKVWLIQVNENPCIQCSSTLLNKLIPRMLNDAFKLTVDQIIDKKPLEDKVYHVDGYEDNESMWESLGELTANAEYVPSSPIPNKKNHKMTMPDIMNYNGSNLSS